MRKPALALLAGASALNAWFLAFRVVRRAAPLEGPGLPRAVFAVALFGGIAAGVAVWRRQADEKSGVPLTLRALLPLLGSIPLYIFSRYYLLDDYELLPAYLALAILGFVLCTAFALGEPGSDSGLRNALLAAVAWLGAAALAGLASDRVGQAMIFSGDLAIQDHALWATWHGQGFLPNFFLGQSIFSEHLLFILVPLLPLHKLWPGPEALTLFLYGGLALCGIIIAWRAAAFSWWQRLALAGLFVVWPGISGQFLFCAHAEVLALPLLALAYGCYRRERWGAFIALLIAVCLTVEYLALTVAAFGVLAVLERRERRWVLVPLLLGLGYAALAYAVLTIPRATPGGALALLASPGTLWQTMVGRRDYLEQLLLPVLVILPFFGRAWLLGVPAVLVSLFLVEPGRYGVFMHTSAPASLFLFISAAEGLERLAPQRRGWVAAALAMMLLVSLSFLPPWTRGPQTPPAFLAELKERVGGDSVTCSRRLSYLFSRRPVIRFYEHREATEWVIVDGQAGWEQDAADATDRALAADPAYELQRLAKSQGGLKLYRRKE